jgi:hypothetical protein
MAEQKVLFIFIDGLGSGDPAVNPLSDTSRFPSLGKPLTDCTATEAERKEKRA